MPDIPELALAMKLVPWLGAETVAAPIIDAPATPWIGRKDWLGASQT